MPEDIISQAREIRSYIIQATKNFPELQFELRELLDSAYKKQKEKLDRRTAAIEATEEKFRAKLKQQVDELEKQIRQDVKRLAKKRLRPKMLAEILQQIQAQWYLKTMRDGPEYEPIWNYFETEIINPAYEAAMKKHSEPSR